MSKKIWPILITSLVMALPIACSAPSLATEPLTSPISSPPTETPRPTLSFSEESTQWALTPTIRIPPTATLMPYVACLGFRPSRVEVGDIVYVSLSPVPNQIRSEPSVETGEIIGQAPPGEMLEVLDGPGCADHIVWWQVRMESTGLVGWTGEGDSNGWWLVPWYLFTPEPDSN